MYNSQSVGVVIVAAGLSERMQGDDKIFSRLGTTTVLERTVTTFHDCEIVDKICVVLRKDRLEQGEILLRKKDYSKLAAICAGGKRRQDSVLAGLNALPHCQWAIIHDGARPFITPYLIRDGLEAAQETGAAIAAVPVTDTIKLSTDNCYVSQTLPRQQLWAVQTPQVFRLDMLKDCYTKTDREVTDDATIVESAGKKIKIYMGSYDNIKLTTPTDLRMAQAICQQTEEKCV
ncbi:MAG: 2-C-methyl-D-erythritol 4-phosphate cytidylyltransferase [Dehalococcoidia bacterium]|nr:2-C-methyl-D-erythritol 4-phosphate cytidylyltransferase [Dehalococcoidia bacterium]